MARGKKHTPEQIVSLLRQIEVGVANVTSPQVLTFPQVPHVCKYESSLSL